MFVIISLAKLYQWFGVTEDVIL